MLIIKQCKFVVILFFGLIILPTLSYAYPVFSQNDYSSNAREISGKLICANCHLEEKKIKTEIPRTILPDSVFEVSVSIPYDPTITQLAADGRSIIILVGSVLLLPEGFQLAPENRLFAQQEEFTTDNLIQPYNSEKKNILVGGPILPDDDDKKTKFIFPILSPNLTKKNQSKFLDYKVSIGLNIGRGQVYPNGKKSNNNLIFSNITGRVISVEWKLVRKRKSTIRKKIIFTDAEFGGVKVQSIPAGLCIIVAKRDFITVGDPLTLDPNQGGFGQAKVGLVLQNSKRIQAMIVFFFTVTIAQILLVIKKKQFEKVQLAEINF